MNLVLSLAINLQQSNLELCTFEMCNKSVALCIFCNAQWKLYILIIDVNLHTQKKKKPKRYIFTMQQWQAYLKTKQIKGSDIFNILDVIFWEIYSEDCK